GEPKRVLSMLTTAPTEAPDAVSNVVFSADGQYVGAAGFKAGVKVRDVDSDEQKWAREGGTSLLAFAGPGVVADLTLWDLRTGKDVRTLLTRSLSISTPAEETKVTSVAGSPNGERLAVGNDLGAAYVFDVNTGRELFTLYGNTKSLSGGTAVAFSPDGSRLA